MSGVSVSHQCDDRRKWKRKSVSPCYRGEPLAGLGAVQTHPPCSLLGSCFMHPLRVPGVLVGGTKATWLLAEQLLQTRGEVTWNRASPQ